MTRILHLIDSLAVGGAEKLLATSINGMNDYEHHLMILRNPETLRNEITVPYKFTNLQCTRFIDLFSRRGKVRRYIRDNNIDIVHSHLYEANILARLATPRNVTLYNSIHAISSMASYNVNRLTLYLERLTYRKRHNIIAVSKVVMDDFRKWVGIKGKEFVLYNFIDGKYFQIPQKNEQNLTDQLRLVAVGNLRYQKNYPYLLQAFKELPANVSLDIYGEGELRKSFQEEIEKNKLNIRLCGIRHDLDKLLPGYDAFVMSSHYEGQPLGLLEALAAGLPPMLSDLPVFREITGDDAIYFDISRPETFRQKVKDILEKRINLKALADAGSRRINAFAHREQFLSRLKKIYQENSISI